MDSNNFRQYFEENRLTYDKWGKSIVDVIIRKLGDNPDLNPDLFIKIPPVPRIKSIESALGKIGRKKYDDPVNQMTDLVGVRFVVLLSENIQVISDIIKAEEGWNVLNSKDFRDEISTSPKLFDYQSQHFEVRPRDDVEIEGTLVLRDICCEVQIRTLLQHAYAELVHDSIYKPVGPVPPKAERQVAKSMALMETTDDLFCSTMQILRDTNEPRSKVYRGLMNLYEERIGRDLLKPDEKTNFSVLDKFRSKINGDLLENVAQLIDEKKYIPEKVRARAPTSPFFAQPSSLFVYWLVNNIGTDEVHKDWPLPGYFRDLETVFSDLGLNYT
jgi:putative GTP pyrophosphokinase